MDLVILTMTIVSSWTLEMGKNDKPDAKESKKPETVKAVWATLIDEEGEVQEAQRQEQENHILRQEAMSSRIIGLIETGIEDLMGASNGIITWN